MSLWDSGLWDTAKWSTIEATLALSLDDLIVVAAGQDVHAGYIALALDDVTVSVTGTTAHNGTLTALLDDADALFLGKDVHVGQVAIQLADIDVNIQQAPQASWGGIDKRKKKKHVNQNAEIEKTIRKIIDGEPADEEVAEIEPEQPKPVIQIEDKSPEFKAQIDQILSQIEAIELAELDDEETLLMLL